MSDRLIIRKANYVIDVFFGETGFDSKHWTRFAIAKHPGGQFLKYIKGASLSAHDLAKVKTLLEI